MLLEAARLSNNSRFSLRLGFRLQTKTRTMMTIAKIIVPPMATRMISFFDSIIGIRAFVVFSVVMGSVVVKTSVVVLIVNSVISLVVVDSVVVRTGASLVVNISELVKISIFCF